MQSIGNNDEKLKEKINGVYKEILSNMYLIGCANPRELNKGDIDVFYAALRRLFDLKQEYGQKFSDREVLGNQISALASELIILADRINNLVRSDADNYKSESELFIKDFEKIIYILFNAQNSSHFSLKKIYATGIGSFEIKHGTRKTEQIGGVVYLIGDSTVLQEVEEEKIYSAEDVRSITTKLLESNKSLIVTSNYYFDTNLLPYTSVSEPLEIKGCSSIYCYLKDDELKKVVNKLLAYAAKNGNHINDISENEILNNISIGPKKIKQLKNPSIIESQT